MTLTARLLAGRVHQCGLLPDFLTVRGASLIENCVESWAIAPRHIEMEHSRALFPFIGDCHVMADEPRSGFFEIEREGAEWWGLGLNIVAESLRLTPSLG